MRINYTHVFALLALMLFSCGDSTGVNTSSPNTETAELNLSIKTGKVANIRAISLMQMVVELTSDANNAILVDTIDISGNGSNAQNVSKLYQGLLAPYNWTLSVKTLDAQGIVIHEGSQTVTTVPYQTSEVTIDLAAMYSQFSATFHSLPDSITACKIIIDQKDTLTDVFPMNSKAGLDVTLLEDYLTASIEGTAHNFELLCYGAPWGVDTLMYSGMATLTVFSGKDSTISVMLNYVGPTEFHGDAQLEVSLGKVGNTHIDIDFEGALSKSFSDNFDDGDYLSNPAWANTIHGTIYPGTTTIVNGTVHLKRTGAGATGEAEGISIDTTIGLTPATTITFDANPVYRSVGDGYGWYKREYPAIIRLTLEDKQGVKKYANYCVNYGDAVADSVYIHNGGEIHSTIQFAKSIPQNQWTHNISYNIADAWPEAAKILKVEIYAAGWDFESYIDNLSIK